MKLLYLLLALIPLQIFAQGKNEISLHIKNGLLLNKGDLEQISGNRKLTDVKNTLQQSIGGNYTRVTKYNLLLSGGLDAGYEQYKSKVNYPATVFISICL